MNAGHTAFWTILIFRIRLRSKNLSQGQLAEASKAANSFRIFPDRRTLKIHIGSQLGQKRLGIGIRLLFSLLIKKELTELGVKVTGYKYIRMSLFSFEFNNFSGGL